MKVSINTELKNHGLSDLDGLMSANMCTPGTSSEADGDLWCDLSREYNNEETPGKPVNGGITQMVNTMISKRINEDTLSQKIKSFLRPANIEGLITPRVNSVVWDRLSPEVRTFDYISCKKCRIA